MKDSNNTKEEKKVNFKRSGREMAIQYLYQFDLGNFEYKQRELNLFWQQIEEGSPDEIDNSYYKSKKYAERIIFGIIENIHQLDETISKFSEKWSMDRMSVIDRNILRVAVFEMLFCEDIPPVVSINEAVEISKDFATDKSGAFVNGILNGVKNSLKRPAREAAK